MTKIVIFTLLLSLLTTIVFSLGYNAWGETWEATGYCACVKCCGKSDGITASGLKAKEGQTIAINWLPFNTRVYINGKPYYVEDRGAKSIFGDNSNHKKRVDIYFASHKQALQFGKRNVDVVIK